MIKEAIENLGGQASYSAIKQFIWRKYGDVNESTINAQIVICTVNHRSRVHYTQNKRPRLANEPRYDFLFHTGSGQVELYNPEKHGVWEILKDERGNLLAAQKESNEIPLAPPELENEEEGESLSFPFESHLRDFIASNLDSIRVDSKRLKLFVDEHGRDGIEYQTAVGPIDILALDEDGNFVVFELKLSKGSDRTTGQISRYMGWVKKHLAGGKAVKGIIVAQSIDEQLKYSVSVIPEISLFEYEISFNIRPVRIED